MKSQRRVPVEGVQKTVKTGVKREGWRCGMGLPELSASPVGEE